MDGQPTLLMILATVPKVVELYLYDREYYNNTPACLAFRILRETLMALTWETQVL